MNDASEESAQFRLPRASFIGGPCDCAGETPVFAKLQVRAVDANGDPLNGHFIVRAPWHVNLPDVEQGCASAIVEQCTDDLRVLWTDSPDAPSVNVYYAPGPCPG